MLLLLDTSYYMRALPRTAGRSPQNRNIINTINNKLDGHIYIYIYIPYI